MIFECDRIHISGQPAVMNRSTKTIQCRRIHGDLHRVVQIPIFQLAQQPQEFMDPGDAGGLEIGEAIFAKMSGGNVRRSSPGMRTGEGFSKSYSQIRMRLTSVGVNAPLGKAGRFGFKALGAAHQLEAGRPAKLACLVVAARLGKILGVLFKFVGAGSVWPSMISQRMNRAISAGSLERIVALRASIS